MKPSNLGKILATPVLLAGLTLEPNNNAYSQQTTKVTQVVKKETAEILDEPVKFEIAIKSKELLEAFRGVIAKIEESFPNQIEKREIMEEITLEQLQAELKSLMAKVEVETDDKTLEGLYKRLKVVKEKIKKNEWFEQSIISGIMNSIKYILKKNKFSETDILEIEKELTKIIAGGGLNNIEKKSVLLCILADIEEGGLSKDEILDCGKSNVGYHRLWKK